MSEEKAEATGRQLRVHTQYLVAITSVAKALGWSTGDPIELSVSRNGNIVIKNLQDADTITENKVVYTAEQAEKEAAKKAKEEEKARIAAEKKAAKEEAAKTKAAEEAAKKSEESDEELEEAVESDEEPEEEEPAEEIEFEEP